VATRTNIKKKGLPFPNNLSAISSAKDTGDLSDSQLLSLFLTNAQENYLLLDRNLKIVIYNEKTAVDVKNLFGLQLYKGMSIFELAQPERKKMLEKLYAEVLSGNAQHTEIKLSIPGKERYISNGFRPARNEKGEVVGVIVAIKDITINRQAEQALKESEDRWRFALEGSNQGLWDWNIQTGDCYFSSSYKKLYGFNDNEIENRIEEWQIRAHPDDRIILDEAIKNHISSTNPYYECVYRVKAKNEQYKWILARGMILEKDGQGNSLRMIGTHTDITEQKNVEENYKLLFYSHPNPMWTYDPQTLRILEVNAAAINLYGYNRDEFVKFTLKDLRPQADIPALQKNIKLIDEGEIRTSNIVRHQKKSGEIFFAEVNGNYITEQNKQVRIISVKDITEQVLTEEKLKDSESQYRLLFTSNPLPSFIYDIDTLQFLEVNEAAVEYYGFSREEFLNITLLDIHKEEHKTLVRKTVAGNNEKSKISIGKWEQKKKSGQQVWVRISGNKIAYNGKNARLIMIDDITEKVKTDEEIIKSNERFKLATKATSDAVYDWDLATNVLSWGEGMQTLFNFSSDEVTIEKWQTLIHKDDYERVVQSLKKAIEHPRKKFWKEQYRFKKKDGAYSYVLDRAFIVRGDYGKPLQLIGAMQDITELKSTEKELIKSNERYRYVSMATSEIIWDWDINSGNILWSDNYTKVLGWELPADNIIPGEQSANNIHPNDRERVLNSLQNTLQNPMISKRLEEFRYLKIDGSYAYILDKAHVIRNEKGEAVRMIGAMEDVSHQKYHAQLVEMERKVFELNASNEIAFENVVNALLEGIEAIHHDMMTSVVLLNNDQTIKTLAAPRIPAAFTNQVNGLQIGPNEGSCGTAMFLKTEIIVSNIAGDPIWKKYKGLATQFDLKACWAFPILDNMGMVMGSLAIYHHNTKEPDTTEVNTIKHAIILLRILLEKQFSLTQIQVANERFDSVMQATHDLIWDWDLITGSFYRDKKGMKKVFGVEDEKSIENIYVWMQRIHPDDHEQVESTISNIIKATDQEIFELEYRFKRDDGLYNYVFDRGIIIRNEEGKPLRMIGAAQDITQRKHMEQQLLQRELDKQKLIGQATIETQEQERSEIGRELHDNVNQVLTTTKLYLDLSLSNPELKDDLIQKSSKNVIYVINEIRQLSRSLMDPSLGDLGLVDSIHDLIENINITRKLHVTLKAGEELEDTLTENQKLTLFRIIQEALNNAIKHAKATKVFINLYQSKSNLLLKIKDDGVGFEPVSVKKGSGLKNIQNRVYLANGTISIESTPGKGCNIEIKFPITNKKPN
jgi:PAS domain S-box-containing protein